eukprot:jgi/Undpi1/9727/HiC_scaffold_27.g12183.m1
MGQQRRDGVSMHGILHRLEQAVNGTYRAKGYSEHKFDSAILSMRLGGQALLHALHKAAGFSGASLVYAKIRERSMKFVVCASFEAGCLVAAITANLGRFAWLYVGEKRVIILQVDEIATEPRARYYAILGLCVQHTPAKSTKFNKLDSLEDLATRLANKHSHIGVENTVISACALGQRPHDAIPVVTFASCKYSNPQQQRMVLKTLGWRGAVLRYLKRLRTRDISKKGVKISTNALALNFDSFPELFAWYDGKPKETYRTLVNPEYRQNVGLVIKMESKQVEVTNAGQGRLTELTAKPGLAALHRDLKLCHDLQATIHGIFFVVLKVQDHCPATPVFLWQISTGALENMFGVVRNLTHSSNINGKELRDRLGAAVALEEIYAKHPSLCRKSRRLSLTHLGEIDHMNVRTWAEAGPAGSCDVRSAKVASCWNEGRRIAIGVPRDHEEYTGVTQATFDGFKDKGITMFVPFGPDKDVPGVRAEDDSDPRVDPEDVLGQATLPSEGGGDSDAAEIRKALDTDVEEPSLGGHSPFMQVGNKMVRAAFVATAPPVDGETASGQVVKGHLLWIRLVDKGDGPTLEWESRKLHTATTYTCSLAVVVELDPTLDMSKKTYVFSMDKLITTQNVIQETAENVQGWEAVPDVRPPPRGNVAPLPLHDALTCKAGGALGEEDVPVASVDGNAECPLCFAEVAPKKLLQPMEGHILEDEEGSSGEEEYSDKVDSDDGRNSEDEDVDEGEEGEEGGEEEKGGGKGEEKEGEEEEEEQEEKEDILSSRGRSRTR